MPGTAIAGPSDLVTRTAGAAAEEGGSVVDVAVVAATVAMCSDPGVCAPGAGGYLSIDLPGEDPIVVDGYMAFPGLGFDGEPFTREVSMEYGGGVVTHVDAGSIAVPGAFAALAMAHDRFGRIPWAELFGLVADSLKPGFPVSRAAYTYLLDCGEGIFGHDPVARKALFDGDRIRGLGEIIVFEDLGPALRAIGDEGVDLFYRGDIARAIADDLAERGSRLTRRDLEAYEAIVRHPLQVEIAGWRIETNPPPAVGGVTVAAALGRIAASGHPLDPVEWYSALRASFMDRSEELAQTVDREAAGYEVLRRAGLRSPSTVSVAVMGERGESVAGTFSAGYGSGVVPKGTGMLMNNSVGEIELLPGGVETHRPGERMLSNMAPTVARGPDRKIAIGSPGADRITTACAITLVRAVLGGDELEAAIDHPRIHPEFTEEGERAAAEPGLDLDGLNVPIRSFDEPHMFFGGVNGAALRGEELTAYADKRRTGSARVV